MGKLKRRLDIQTLQHAVAGYIGINNGAYTGILKALAQFESRDLRGLGPAIHRHQPVACVNTHRHTA